MKAGKSVKIVLTVLMLLSGFVMQLHAQTNWVDGTLITFNNSGAWCWYQDERAIVDAANNKLVISFNRTSNGRNYVTIYDLVTGATQEYDFGSLGSDDHNAPGLIKRPDGKYLAMYAQHYDYYNSRYRIFDGSSWTAEQRFNWTTIPGGTDYTIAYSNLYYLSSENRMYNFARANNRAPNFLISTNQGDSWTFGGQIKTNSSSSYNKGYFKYWSNGIDRIDFICTEQHPRDTYTSMYHGYIKDGKSYRTDGTVADSDIFDRTYIPTDANFTRIFADNTSIGGYTMRRIWNADLMRYNDGTIAAILTARTDTYSGGDSQINPQHAFIYCRYNGSSWSSTYLCLAGRKLYGSEADYTGLAALHPNDPNTIYVSTTYSPINNAQLIKHEIFKGVTTNNGQTWTWSAVTMNSTVDNLRPIIPDWDVDKTALIWFRGTYNSAQNINASIVGLIDDEPLPVELTGFTAKQFNNSVELNWITETETNNLGFDVERRIGSTENSNWEKITFIDGNGNSNSPKSYSYKDENVSSRTTISYRLKQIDFDGAYAYSHVAEVKAVPASFELSQNYPNPFNPTTTINYNIPVETDVDIKVYDVLGNEVKTLVSSFHQAGNYEIKLDAADFASGIYFYKMQAGKFVKTQKMIVLK